jgi:hypothetical protein
MTGRRSTPSYICTKDEFVLFVFLPYSLSLSSSDVYTPEESSILTDGMIMRWSLIRLVPGGNHWGEIWAVLRKAKKWNEILSSSVNFTLRPTTTILLIFPLTPLIFQRQIQILRAFSVLGRKVLDRRWWLGLSVVDYGPSDIWLRPLLQNS